MQSMIRAAIAFCLVCLSAPVLAEPVKTTSLEDAQKLIDKFNVGEVFSATEEPAPSNTKATFIAVKHAQTGFICHFTSDDMATPGALSIFPGGPVGDDVGCTTQDAAGRSSLFITRYSPTPSLNDAYWAAVTSLKQMSPGARSYAPQARMSVTPKEGVTPLESMSTAYLIDVGGVSKATYLNITQKGGWTLAHRFTGSPDLQSDLAMGLAWMAALAEFERLPLSN